MTNDTEKSISDSLETDAVLLPHMPYLLQDMWALGCAINSIQKAIRMLPLTGSRARVLDFGCGKGALAVLLASEFGIKVVGVDAMASFLDEARQKAEEYSVSHL